MKLLVVTQVIDKNDPVLGFFHTWVTNLAEQFESIEVICLKKGEYTLPQNVRVHSLGKERGRPHLGAITYFVRFMRLVWKLRHKYQRVFVHMNQEYILMAGPLWRLLGKRLYLWRNHYAGSLATDIAMLFCSRVFCTSYHSYTAKYKKTVLMPVGVDLTRFTGEGQMREPRSLLFLSRIGPSKRADMLIEALGILLKKGVSFTADIYGSPAAKDETYYANLKARAEALDLHHRVRFHPGVSNEQAPAIFARHEFFVNASPSGMYDKTLFEAAASGCIVLARSHDFARALGKHFQFTTAEDLARKLEELLSAPEDTKASYRKSLADIAEQNALTALIPRLVEELTKP